MMPNNQFLVPKTMSIPYDISSTIMTAVINPKDMGTITRATHNTLYAMPTTAISAVSAGRFATPSLRSIVPPTLLKNATAAYTAVHKSNIAVDLSAINWALAELAALRQVLETDDKDDAELELNRFRDEIAQTKTTASVDKAQLKQARSEEPFPSSPAAESSQPTAKSSKAAAKIGFHSHPVSTPTQPTPAIYTTTTKPTPLSNKAEAKIPECTKSIHRKLGELMERLTSSASSNASSKRLRDIEDVEATPIQYKKPRLARQGSVFTPGGRPSVRLAIPELRPAEAGLKCVPSQDSTKICSSKEDKVIESVKVKTPVVAAKSLSEHSALVPVELQQDPVGDVVMGGSDDEAEVLSSFALAGVKSEASSRNSTSDIDMADSVQDVSIQPNVETTVAPTPSAPGTLRRRSKLPVPTNSPVRKSTRLAGMTQDLSEKSLRERSTSPLKTATTLSGKAGSQPPPSSKPAGVTKTSARQTRFVSPKKMDAVKSAAASPRKRK
ncbi:predicted protein [Pyrenophora tritici-repentis Pt-1C-BFP]|uniref:Uncharacterized protein n=1 Tax=Pyrenophora tritici-repentis (strain Pt-1C-BFP) TaxID=426418 RepID=B2W2V8_PYRTR|nr:uncharacterized protein PTRG_03756 [Pyrenophora tritici-repentis Pt-1C-BFP]EDU46594.1 predicted protein [Pyrenophora tritici-repentis Pt-1C-BFP]